MPRCGSRVLPLMRAAVSHCRRHSGNDSEAEVGSWPMEKHASEPSLTLLAFGPPEFLRLFGSICRGGSDCNCDAVKLPNCRETAENDCTSQSFTALPCMVMRTPPHTNLVFLRVVQRWGNDEARRCTCSSPSRNERIRLELPTGTRIVP